jgi:hypothetical protein
MKDLVEHVGAPVMKPGMHRQFYLHHSFAHAYSEWCEEIGFRGLRTSRGVVAVAPSDPRQANRLVLSLKEWEEKNGQTIK